MKLQLRGDAGLYLCVVASSLLANCPRTLLRSRVSYVSKLGSTLLQENNNCDKSDSSRLARKYVENVKGGVVFVNTLVLLSNFGQP